MRIIEKKNQYLRALWRNKKPMCILVEPPLALRPREVTSATEILLEIKREMDVFEATGERPARLNKIYRAMTTLPASSVEAERTFSAAGLFLPKIRSSLSDRSLDNLVFLRKYFQNKKKGNE